MEYTSINKLAEDMLATDSLVASLADYQIYFNNTKSDIYLSIYKNVGCNSFTAFRCINLLLFDSAMHKQVMLSDVIRNLLMSVCERTYNHFKLMQQVNEMEICI